MKQKIEIWGVYPPPIGGISMYCRRLVESLHLIDDNVSMLNFAHSKTNIEYVRDVRYPIFEFLKLPFVSRKIIHVQLRNVYFLVLLYMFGWRHSIVITLHNRKMLLLKGWQKYIINLFLKRTKHIIYNDDKFTEELLSMYSIDSSKISILPTYMSPSEEERKGLASDIENFINVHKYTISTNASVIVRNSWGDVYGLDQLIDLMNRLVNERKMDVGIVFLLAQIGDKSYYEDCCKTIEKLHLQDNFLIIVGSKVNGFEVWEKTDLFIRATMSDMEGISVKESLQFGTPVIASDVCSRPKEAVLYRAGDVNDLYNKSINMLESKYRVSYFNDVEVPSSIYNIYLSIIY
jgi:glycosyltransferase involved in cell wall biosynthesis